MNNPYTIQRGFFEERDCKKGIDSIIKFDYMGASEFEWGALPKALKRLRKNVGEYAYHDVSVGDKMITIFCKESIDVPLRFLHS